MSFLGGLAGGAIGGAVVNLYLDDKQFKAGLASAETSTKSAGTTASRFGNIAAAGFAAAAAGAVAFGASAIASAREHEEAVQRLTMALGESSDAIAEQANTLQMSTGFSDEAILQADALLSKYDLTAEQLSQLNPLLLDYARFTGQDAATAAGGLGKALLGSTRALKAVGIEFEATGDRSADLATLMDALRSKVDGTAEAFGQTSAGQAEILAQKFDELKEKIGAGLLPILGAFNKILGTLIDLLPVITGMVVAFGLAWAAVNFGQVVNAISNITKLLITLIPQLVLANAEVIAMTAGLGLAAAAFFYVASDVHLFTDAIEGMAKEVGTTAKAIVFMKQHHLDFDTALQFVRQDVDLLTYSYDKQGRRVENLAGMTNDAMKEFRDATKENFSVAGDSAFGFKAKFEGTARSFIRGLDNMRQRAQETFRDLREFNKIDLGDGVKKFLLEQGPAAIDAFTDANKQGRDKIVDDIRAILDAHKKQGTEIDNATQKTVDLTAAVGRLGQKNANPTVTFAYKVSGGEALEQFLQLSSQGQ